MHLREPCRARLSVRVYTSDPPGVWSSCRRLCLQWLPLYGDEVVRQYHNRPYGSLPPHCFQEAEDAYQQLQFTHRNQSVIICGESGAGKTETTKLMLQYLSIVAREKSATGGKREKTIGEKLVQSNPLMVRTRSLLS